MLNFRKLRRDFAAAVLQEGKELFDKKSIVDAKILHIDGEIVRLSANIKGAYDNCYESEIEIDRSESETVDSNCDCSYTYDCQHIVALLFYLEIHFDAMVVSYSQEANLEAVQNIDEEVKKELKEAFEYAANKEEVRKDQQHQKEILSEYIAASKVLSASPFFLPAEHLKEDLAELGIIFVSGSREEIFCPFHSVDFQIFLRLPNRSKPIYVPNVKAFLEAVHYQEPIVLSGKRFFFTLKSFESRDQESLHLLFRYACYANPGIEERFLKSAQLPAAALGKLLAKAYDASLMAPRNNLLVVSDGKQPFAGLFLGNLEDPLWWSSIPSKVKFILDRFESPYRALLLTPLISFGEEETSPEKLFLLESDAPGLIHEAVYYRFVPQIKRNHLRSLLRLREITVPEALFGTFVENALPVLKSYADVINTEVLDSVTTLPYVGNIQGVCEMSYLNGELEAHLFFIYNDAKISVASNQLQYKTVAGFIGTDGILSRNLVEERKISEEVFADFIYDEKDGVYRLKSEKKIVDFMTETIPKNQYRMTFQCPENLSEQFIYDETHFELDFQCSDSVDTYEVRLKVNGLLKGIHLDLLWDCIGSKKCYVELPVKRCNNVLKAKKSYKHIPTKLPRILVLDLEKLVPLVQIFNEIGFRVLDDMVEKRPLWSLTSIHQDQFESLPITMTICPELEEIQKQIRGEISFDAKDIPMAIRATLRKYQVEGVQWLERLRKMHLNGILADDMGLGKTLQAIIAITQSKAENPKAQSLVVCPTSLVYNWKEEFRKFNPELETLAVDGIPMQRRKQLKSLEHYDVIITSYNLLQKDIEIYKDIKFDYMILDEAHHIKNRTTRNAKSVKAIAATHRLILTGTPIENSLEELWSLFDFLMPGFLSTYDRFVGKYIRNCGFMGNKTDNLEALKKKVAPFILRRMKEDVLEDLPPVSEILYHCHLTDSQKELYQSYAASAKVELSRLVKQEGFDKIHIHVLATLTRLKQICCHPAIFAKDKHEAGDSAKYDMLIELLLSLIEGGHKTVVFSQYTKMLTIMKTDLEERGIAFMYLDGSTKNRLDIVNRFNDDPNIPIFLVSLKAGGTGLNLVGADTVIHYDMWWNPAVENQATDRVRRIGQRRSVSSYKLVTLNTIEEKILQMQNKKRSLVKKVISTDDEVIYKLTWEEVLELLQT
ncbi:DEAD/DEAH box helicase [Candidatus Clavichlamydia salmonicola]|uniref:DEAD/DEAH box helicase n=1 Tax=Candidatus Clavichlamydia salmonicola TaxID=469812 RepID=UPI001891BFAC|nr:DEAD/DEAH box helicase [Candidatus Clavichlamydia salmonicola]